MISRQPLWPGDDRVRDRLSFWIDDIFDPLDRELGPRLWMIGFQMNGGRLEQTLLSPSVEDELRVSLQGIEDVLERRLDRAEVESQQMAEADGGAPSPRRLRSWDAKSVVEEQLATSALAEDFHSTVGFATEINGLAVVPILSLRRVAAENHPYLKKARGRHGRIFRSLLEAVASFAVDNVKAALPLLADGSLHLAFFHLLPPNQIRVHGASHLMQAMAFETDEDISPVQLFAACESLSKQPYERSDARCQLIICKKGHTCVETLIELVEPVPLGATKAARKILQMGAPGLLLLSDGAAIWGLGRPSAVPNNGDRLDLLEVAFCERHRWELRHGGQCLFAVVDGEPQLPRPRLSQEDFRCFITNAFRGLTTPNLTSLWAVVDAVLSWGRGAIVVVTPNAAAEAQRLRVRGSPIVPRELVIEAIQASARIDGAIVVDTAGVCHGIGIVLDGIAVDDGDQARGSRYNSALTYVKNQETAAAALVVSDDGSTDFLHSGR